MTYELHINRCSRVCLWGGETGDLILKRPRGEIPIRHYTPTADDQHDRSGDDLGHRFGQNGYGPGCSAGDVVVKAELSQPGHAPVRDPDKERKPSPHAQHPEHC